MHGGVSHPGRTHAAMRRCFNGNVVFYTSIVIASRLLDSSSSFTSFSFSELKGVEAPRRTKHAHQATGDIDRRPMISTGDNVITGLVTKGLQMQTTSCWTLMPLRPRLDCFPGVCTHIDCAVPTV